MISRRDFLKLSSILSAGSVFPHFIGEPSKRLVDPGAPNILIFVFDTWTAANLSQYGYGRETMPNFNRFLERATVYHDHHATGNFTTPGTASLLTGTYPWTHRAMTINGSVIPEFESKNLFSLFEQYHRLGYSHNLLVNTLLKQFSKTMDHFVPSKELFISNLMFSDFFKQDNDTATVSRVRILDRDDDGYSNSLFLSSLYSRLKKDPNEEYADQFPLGLPQVEEDSESKFILEDATNWMMGQMLEVPQPHLLYFHLLPPHAPYHTRVDFVGRFEDQYQPVKKPSHRFGRWETQEDMLKQRRQYDEFILYVDAEIGRLLDFMEDNNIFENSWVVFTSDHGEMFERGHIGHGSNMLFEPLTWVPLAISHPSQKVRADVWERTSCVDLIPTLLKVTNRNIPAWLEGQVMPPFRDAPLDPQRPIFSMQARHTEQFDPLEQVTLSIYKGDHKLIRYAGYPTLPDHVPLYELFNLKKDPDEIKDLTEKRPNIFGALRDELLANLELYDRPYR